MKKERKFEKVSRKGKGVEKGKKVEKEKKIKKKVCNFVYILDSSTDQNEGRQLRHVGKKSQ